MLHKSAAGCTMGIAHPPGYPLFTMLAWLLHKLPVGSPAWRINLLSVLLATASAWLSLPLSRLSPRKCALDAASAPPRRCLRAGVCPLGWHGVLSCAAVWLECAPRVSGAPWVLSVSCAGEAGPGSLGQPHAQWLGVTHVLHVWTQVQLRHHGVLGHGPQRPRAFETASLFLLRISLSLGFGTGERELEGRQRALEGRQTAAALMRLRESLRGGRQALAVEESALLQESALLAKTALPPRPMPSCASCPLRSLRAHPCCSLAALV
jgi:hypothetical protein